MSLLVSDTRQADADCRAQQVTLGCSALGGVFTLQYMKQVETSRTSHHLPAPSMPLAAQAAYSMYTEAVQMLEAGGPDGVSGDVYRQAIGELRAAPRAVPGASRAQLSELPPSCAWESLPAVAMNGKAQPSKAAEDTGDN